MNAHPFALPDLGEGLTEAEIVRWLIAIGDPVTVDQPIVEVETAKAVVEVPSPYAGVVTERHGGEGETVAVGAVLVVVADGAEPAGSEPAGSEPAGSGNVLVGYGTTQPARRRRPSARPATRPPVISPIVRRLAKDHGVDLTKVTGSATGGVITRADVERAMAAPAGPAAEVLERIPLKGALKTAAEAFTRSRREIPEVTTWVDADATALIELRREINARTPESPVGLLALIARFVVAGLARHPELNCRVESDEIVRYATINLGVAMQTPRGLRVPVIKNAHTLTARRLHQELTLLKTRAEAGELTPADLTEGTFTLNNYGTLGVDGSTPIINHPEAALLGIGRIIDRPWISGGELTARKVVQLTLAFDHRACDGAPAAALLRFVADSLESPHQTLADL